MAMTSASILPSVGPPPPNLRRPNVPEELKPKIANPADDLAAGNRRPSRSRQKVQGQEPRQEAPVRRSAGERSASPNAANSGVAVQILEGQIPPSARPTQSESGRPVAEGIELDTEPSPELAPQTDTLKLAGELSPEDEAYVRELQARDREVRAHEAAHATAGSGYAGQPNFEYATGPDGVQYAVGGHVDIDTGKVPDDPAATIQKMEVVRRAALAPARPSGQDRAVAAAAEQAIREAQAELNEARRAESAGESEDQKAPDQGAVLGSVVNASQPTPEGLSGVSSQPSALRPQTISIDLIA